MCGGIQVAEVAPAVASCKYLFTCLGQMLKHGDRFVGRCACRFNRGGKSACATAYD